MIARRLSRYAGVGLVATAVHYAVLVLVVEVGGWPAWLGSGLGATVGAQVAYDGNRRFTFAHRGSVGASWPRFMATAALGALLGMSIVAAGVRLGLWYLAAQAVATGAGLLVTFAINRRWAFAEAHAAAGVGAAVAPDRSASVPDRSDAEPLRRVQAGNRASDDPQRRDR